MGFFYGHHVTRLYCYSSLRRPWCGIASGGYWLCSCPIIVSPRLSLPYVTHAQIASSAYWQLEQSEVSGVYKYPTFVALRRACTIPAWTREGLGHCGLSARPCRVALSFGGNCRGRLAQDGSARSRFRVPRLLYHVTITRSNLVDALHAIHGLFTRAPPPTCICASSARRAEDLPSDEVVLHALLARLQ